MHRPLRVTGAIPHRCFFGIAAFGSLAAQLPGCGSLDRGLASTSDQHYKGHFHGYAKAFGIDLAAPHSDWVAIEGLDPTSFTVQTLKREFWDTKEDVPTSVVGGGVLTIAPWENTG
jgi:hypothetical protein